LYFNLFIVSLQNNSRTTIGNNDISLLSLTQPWCAENLIGGNFIFKNMITEKGSVYFVKHKGLMPIKIGYSSNENPQGRFTNFNIASPYGIQVLGVIITEKPEKLEAELHKKYADKRLNGEWFNISLQDVDMEIEMNNDQDEFDRRHGINMHYLSHIERMDKSNIIEGSTVSIYDMVIECMQKRGYYPDYSESREKSFMSGSDLKFEISAYLGFSVVQKDFKMALLNAVYKVTSYRCITGWNVYKNVEE